MSDAALHEKMEGLAQTPIPELGRRSIVLVGMMGAGKSSVGRKLAARLSLPFVDADTKIEEAARTGKLHLDLMAERRKLAREFTELGKEAHLALLEDGIAQLAVRPGIAEMQRNIDKYKKGIADLEARLAAAQKRPKV